MFSYAIRDYTSGKLLKSGFTNNFIDVVPAISSEAYHFQNVKPTHIKRRWWHDKFNNIDDFAKCLGWFMKNQKCTHVNFAINNGIVVESSIRIM